MSEKGKSYFSTIDQNEWGGIDKKMRDVIFHKYFLGTGKGGRGIETKWNDDNKHTKGLFDFVSKRKFDEYGNITHKICKYDGRLYPIGMFRKHKSTRDGYESRMKRNSSKLNRR